MKYVLMLAGVVFVLCTLAFYIKNPLVPRAVIRGKTFYLDLAVTAAQKEKGLGYRKSMPEDVGMLFPYDHKEQYGFWMKGMEFPLDVLWIDGMTVVDITVHVPAPQAGTEIAHMQPSVPVDKILELNAGTVEKYGMNVGDQVQFITK